MLLSNYGASTLGKTLRRPIVLTMTSFEGNQTSASEKMRSTLTAMRGGRALSAAAARPNHLSQNIKTWRPSHGIVFNNAPTSIAPGSPRSSSGAVTASEIEQDLILQVTEQDNRVMEPAQTTAPLLPEGTSSHPTIAVETHTAVLSPKDEAAPRDTVQNELPQSTTTFQMPEELFRQAKNAANGSPESYWSHTLYRGPGTDANEQKVKVHYCKSKHTTERTMQYFADKKVIGFDMEWKGEANRNQGAKKNVSLIQLACEDRIALLHIALYQKDEISDLVAPTLKKILEDPNISKVGVAIKADCTRLRKYLDIHARGIFELSHLYKLVKFSDAKDFKQVNKKLVSLATQVQEHLHLPMFKGEVRSSDWSQTLQMDQILYAASDSYAGIHLYDTMEMKRKSLDPTPPRPYHAEENKPIRLAQGVEIPADEGAEDLEPEEPELFASGKMVYSKFSSSYLASATENLEVDPDVEISTLPITTSSMSPTLIPNSKDSKSLILSAATVSKSPIVQTAESEALSYRISNPEARATHSSLRAYFIWHQNPSLSLHDIAALLRKVPLQSTTVVNYILEAVKLEKLPFEKDRLRVVLAVLPKDVVWWRYRSLAKACGDVTTKE